MTKFFFRWLSITISLLGNAKLPYILLKTMEYGSIRHLMIWGFGCWVYRFFLITAGNKNSLLEIIYISSEYPRISDREK